MVKCNCKPPLCCVIHGQSQGILAFCTRLFAAYSMFTNCIYTYLCTPKSLISYLIITGFMAEPKTGGSNMLCLPINNGGLGHPGASSPPGVFSGLRTRSMVTPLRSSQTAIPSQSVLFCNVCFREDKQIQVS